MNDHEAKFFLRACRPSGGDAGDPAMGAALDRVRIDPTLAAWFGREQAYDAAVAAKLREMMPPAGLREAILAGGKASGARDLTASAETRRTGRWIRPVWLAVAAVIAVLLAVFAGWRLAPVRGETLEAFAANYVEKGFMLSERGGDLTALKTWLGERHGPLPATLPAKFAELRALGCKTLKFRGNDVSLVCFEHGGKEFHVFVARREGAGGAADTVPRMVGRGNSRLAAATWTDAKNRYVLVSKAGAAAVRELL